MVWGDCTELSTIKIELYQKLCFDSDGDLYCNDYDYESSVLIDIFSIDIISVDIIST